MTDEKKLLAKIKKRLDFDNGYVDKAASKFLNDLTTFISYRDMGDLSGMDEAKLQQDALQDVLKSFADVITEAYDAGYDEGGYAGG